MWRFPRPAASTKVSIATLQDVQRWLRVAPPFLEHTNRSGQHLHLPLSIRATEIARIALVGNHVELAVDLSEQHPIFTQQVVTELLACVLRVLFEQLHLFENNIWKDCSSSDDECICSVYGDETRDYWTCDMCEGTICNKNCGYWGGETCGQLHCESCGPESEEEEDPPTAAAWVLQSAQMPADVCQRVLGFVA